jgi:hypothetical protein
VSICPAGIVTGGGGGGIAPVCGFAGAVVLFVVAVCGLGLLQAMNTTSAAAAAPKKILSKTRMNLPPVASDGQMPQRTQANPALS